jgi:very-short-patch-repair endonuclease
LWEGVGGGVIRMKSPLRNAAKSLRKQATNTEWSLWFHLQAKQLEGLKFRRQQPIGKYIVDFVCFEKKVIIEVDGGQHSENGYDRVRDEWLIKEGFKVLRFWNNEVLNNIAGVLEVIRSNCLKSSSPTPPIEGGEKYEGVHND